MNNDPFYIIAALIVVHIAREFFDLKVTYDLYKPSWQHILVYIGMVLLVAMVALLLAEGMEEVVAAR